MDGALLVANWNAAGGGPRWHAIVPRDDGTVAAAVAASRLSDGGREPALTFLGKPIAVTRLGRPGATLSAQPGDAVIFGNTRDELLRAALRLTHGKMSSPGRTGTDRLERTLLLGSAMPVESGVTFGARREPGRERAFPASATAAGQRAIARALMPQPAREPRASRRMSRPGCHERITRGRTSSQSFVEPLCFDRSNMARASAQSGRDCGRVDGV